MRLNHLPRVGTVCAVTSTMTGVAFVLIASACTKSTPSTPPPSHTKIADTVCRHHFANFVLARGTTVGMLLSAGPHTSIGDPLQAYRPSTRVTLCLVPADHAFAARAVAPDGSVSVRWIQDSAHMFQFPT